ncbi:MAG: M1 family metallopeptidase [Planctomycetes bacterium]|nr:M1 family metallopeptidase [Planctomycetota bacterium]
MLVRSFLPLLTWLLGAVLLYAQTPESLAKTLRYSMDCQLVDHGRLIRGSELVQWTNKTPVPTNELWWHVYNNAFAGRDSVWMKEAHQYQYGDGRLPREWGGTDIESMQVTAFGEQEFAPEDLEWNWVAQPGAPNDQTVLRCKLPMSVEPGTSVTVRVKFQAKMVPAYRRNGWGSGGYLHAAQWFPKVGVFERVDGEYQWNCPPYHMLVEFYSDYADFRVKLTLPPEYKDKVVATGEQRSEPEQLPDGHWQYIFWAEDVHDFAWTVDPEATLMELDFVESEWRDEAEENKVAAALGVPVEEVRPDVTVRMFLLLQPEHEHLARKYFDALGKSIYYFGLWYGKYPYATISLVDPAHDARNTGGMEYPRLITGGARLGKAERSQSPSGVTVHEFGHQYWYGLVGTDEFRHAWMDEGFCTFSTQRVLAKAFEPEWSTYTVLGKEFYGQAPLQWPAHGSKDLRSLFTLTRLESPSVSGLPPISAELWRPNSLTRFLAEMPPVSYWPQVVDDAILGERRAYRTDFYQPVSTPSLELFEWRLRGVNTYARPAMTLETMARLMGEERWIRTMRAYHQRYRFKHPRPADWFEVVKEFATGAMVGAKNADQQMEIHWPSFWRQAYDGNEVLDFGVHRVANLPHLIDAADEPQRAKVVPNQWDVHIELRRLGQFEVPVEVEVNWADGATTQHVWDGSQSTWALRILGSNRQVLQVVIDPQRKLVLDSNWLNNTYTVETDADLAFQAGVRALLWAQAMMHFFGGIG